MTKHNAADHEDIKDKDEQERFERKRDIEDLRVLLNTPQGIRFFRRLLKEGRIFTTSFTGNSNTFFLEGQRNLALKFFEDICTAAPDKVAELMIVKPEGEN